MDTETLICEAKQLYWSFTDWNSDSETVTHERELGWKGDERRGRREEGMKGVCEKPLLLLTKALRFARNWKREGETRTLYRYVRRDFSKVPVPTCNIANITAIQFYDEINQKWCCQISKSPNGFINLIVDNYIIIELDITIAW